MHIHYHEEKCYEDEIFFYHLGCHQWVSSHDLEPPITHGKGTERSLGSAITGKLGGMQALSVFPPSRPVR